MSGPSDPPVALSIAGSDSGAGAGIQADLKSMGALGVFGTSAITAVTAQNTAAVVDVHFVPVDMVEAQIDAVLSDMAVGAVKTGMLGTPEVIEMVARKAIAGELRNVVVDPVMVASSGRVLLTADGVDAYREALFPSALVTTPNLWEAALLAGVDPAEFCDVDAMIDMARRIHKLGPTWVLVKGGHLPGVEPTDGLDAPSQVADVLFNGDEVTVLKSPLVETSNTHGTGCSMSSAIAAGLAHGVDVKTAVSAAKQYVHGALVGAADWRLGAGHGPLNHLAWTGERPFGLGARPGSA